MDSLVRAAEYLDPAPSESASVPNQMVISDDQHFLLFFIMGTYFGPDLKEEMQNKSALQRIAEGLPPYTSEQLAGSHMKTMEAERVYYYALKKADQSVIVELPLLQQFFQGSLFPPTQDPSANYRQFPDLFPPHLHPHTLFKNRYKTIENIVFINNPEISYLKPEDVERFKRLTGLERLRLHRTARLYSDDRQINDGMAVQDLEANGKLQRKKSSQMSRKRQRSNDHLETEDAMPTIHDVKPVNSVPYSSTPRSYCTFASASGDVEVGPAMLILPSHPTTFQWNNIVACTKGGIALTGSVAERQAGPIIGLVDIGVSQDAYLFRISLPGVKKDERAFSCEVETDGQVLIKGVTTTGEKLVYKHSQVFEMQTQYLCPSGNFSVSFQLPGPVEPREFSGTFGADGILEGVVMKERSKR